MESTVSNAFLLLGIGMITVFAVLSIVVISGHVLITLVNKYAPDPVKESKLIKPLVSTKEIAVITAVVDHITKGKGKIDSIKKLK
ncbi:MAG: OadG family protein [Saprospiraceae bacterium]|nr:OadG family protein [Saprospiraceae bacterium]